MHCVVMEWQVECVQEALGECECLFIICCVDGVLGEYTMVLQPAS